MTLLQGTQLLPNVRSKLYVCACERQTGCVGLRTLGPFAAGPARLARPELVNALDMPKPKQTNLPPAVYMLHQLAHIELNAINLAWDTVARFSHLNLPTVCLPSP